MDQQAAAHSLSNKKPNQTLNINPSINTEMDEKTPLLSVQGPQHNNSQEPSNKKESSTSSQQSINSSRSLGRQPFTHNSMQNLHGRPEDVHRSATYHRYKYISKLSGHSNLMIIPDHMLPIELFLLIPGKRESKQSSLITIFSIWNTMMGTSILSMPWALSQAGFGLGVGIMLVVAALCLYTSYLILKASEPYVQRGEMVEFADICKKHFGRYGELGATVFSIAAIGGAAIVFWVLMSTFLFNSGKFIHDHSIHAYSRNTSNVTDVPVLCPRGPNSTPTSSDQTGFYKYWDMQKTIPFFLIVLLLPLCSIKSPTFFTKFNSLGTLAVMYIIIFVAVKASIWGIHMDFSGHDKIPEFKLQFPALVGTLTLAYFIHNCVLSIMRTQKNPENNSRDLSIAYFLVAFTYVFVGAVFYAAFPLEKSCISQVFLDNMRPDDGMAFGARIGLFFQLITVFPLLTYIVRVQFMLYFFGKSYPGRWHVLALNILIISACVAFACLYPHVGTIIRYVGSISGLAYIFTLPCLVHLVDKKNQGKLSWPRILIHSFIMLLGVLNLISQFLVTE